MGSGIGFYILIDYQALRKKSAHLPCVFCLRFVYETDTKEMKQKIRNVSKKSFQRCTYMLK